MRVAQLDLLRLVAVLLVLGRHMVPCPEPLSGWLASATETWQRGGWIGVDLFFVLSGFLVSGLLFREHQRTGEARAGHFLIRRGFKIYPAFWVFLGATLVFGGGRAITTRGLVGELLFLQNYVGSLWNHTWSLAIEEHFYFLLAGWVAWRARRQRDDPFAGLPRLFVVVAAACLVMRAITAATLPYSDATHLFPTHLRIDSLLFGVLLSYGWHYGSLRRHPWLTGRRRRWGLALAGAALLLPPFRFALHDTPWLTVVGLAGLTLGSGLILLAMLATDERRFRRVNGLARIGAYSYSIYLWHMPMSHWTLEWAAGLGHGLADWYAYAAVYLLGSLSLGIVTARLIELPVLHLRDRIYPSRSGALPSGTPG